MTMAEDSSDEIEMMFDYEYEGDTTTDTGTESEDGLELGELGDDERDLDVVLVVDEIEDVPEPVAAGEDAQPQAAGGIAAFDHEPLPGQDEEEENRGDARIIDPTRLERIDW